jgi:tRNA(fMet)-specific endonuclease VapC
VIRYLLDSDCAIFATTAQFPALGERLSRCKPGEAGLSVVSYAEIRLGMELGRPPTPEVLAAMIKKIPVLDFDIAAAESYAKLPFKRARFDRLIAAHALSIGAVVVTNNPGDFADVPGLVVENWTE